MLQASSNLTDKLDSLLGEINILATQYKQARQPFQDQGDWTGGVRGVLLILGRGEGQTVPEIARARGTSRQNIQIVVNRLKIDGLAELAANPTHKRSALVRLTEKGKRVLRQIEFAEEKLHQDVLATLSQEELVSATKCLKRLRHLLAFGTGAPPATEPNPSAGKRTRAIRTRDIEQGNPPKTGGLKEEDDAFPVNLL